MTKGTEIRTKMGVFWGRMSAGRSGWVGAPEDDGGHPHCDTYVVFSSPQVCCEMTLSFHKRQGFCVHGSRK